MLRDWMSANAGDHVISSDDSASAPAEPVKNLQATLPTAMAAFQLH